jgi:hypothetical protein
MARGGSRLGTVFEAAAGSGTIATLASFDGANGSHPVGDLLLDAQGGLYGVSRNGVASNRGTIFVLPVPLAAHGRATASRPRNHRCPSPAGAG